MPRYVSTDHGVGRLQSDGTIDIIDATAHGIDELLLRGSTPEQIAELPILQSTPSQEAQLHSPVSRPSKIWLVGWAYAEHAAEVGRDERADEPPMIFLKAPSAITGPYDDIRLPSLCSQMVDYEGEIAAVIGRRARAVTIEQAPDHVLGITAANDVSARDVQRGLFNAGKPDPSKGKSFDTFAPLGPCISTMDEYEDPNDVELTTYVNGERRQHARSRMLRNSIPKLVAFCSQFTTLEPGDVILTGTPAGVGHPSETFLKPGDVVRVEVEGVGAIENRVVAGSTDRR